MKIQENRTSFRNTFLWALFIAVAFYIWIAVGTGSVIWILFSPLLLIPGCVLLTQNLQNNDYEAHALVFDSSGVSMYDGKQMVQHHNWDKYKTRCIISHLGKPEWFYFSHDPLYLGDIFMTQYSWHFEEYRTRYNRGFYSSAESIGFKCTPEMYAVFRKNCPDVEVIRIDTCGKIYVLVDTDHEVQVARVLQPQKLWGYSRVEDGRCALEILKAAEAVRAAEVEKFKAQRAEKPVLTPEEMPVFTIYPEEKKASKKKPEDWARQKAEWEAEEEQRKKDELWLKEFKMQMEKAERVFEIIENPVAQKSVMAAAAPETAEPEPAAVLQTEAVAEITQTEAAAATEEPIAEETAEETVFPEESAEEELEDVRIPGVRSVEEILASASRTVESVRGLGSRFREEDASAEADDTWEEESFFDEDTE